MFGGCVLYLRVCAMFAYVVCVVSAFRMLCVCVMIYDLLKCVVCCCVVFVVVGCSVVRVLHLFVYIYAYIYKCIYIYTRI